MTMTENPFRYFQMFEKDFRNSNLYLLAKPGQAMSLFSLYSWPSVATASSSQILLPPTQKKSEKSCISTQHVQMVFFLSLFPKQGTLTTIYPAFALC
jgi:hypothetical protein